MLSLLLITLALAQAPPAERPAARGNRPPGVTNGELVNMLDTFAIVRAQDALQLEDTQYGQFVTRLKRLQQIRRQRTHARNQILQELRRLTQNTTPDENALRERLKALREHDISAAEDLRRAYEVLDEVLDPRQQARFRIFEEQMERRKLDLLMRARNRAAPARAQPREPGEAR
jgi:Spy/CpxP family protein refolding chaperone